MSFEHARSRESLERPSEPAQVQNFELVSPESGDTASDTEERLASVRERLGLSRREAVLGTLAAGLATAALPDAVDAHTAADSIERMETFEQGLDRLYELASTRTEEDLFFRVRDRNGRERWEQVQGITIDIGITPNVGGGMLGMSDRQVFQRVGERVRRGENIQMFHTHPTPMIARDMGVSAETQGIRRVPPSPIDIINTIGIEQGLSEEQKGRLSFEAITEEGRWVYDSEDAASMATALAAVEPSLSALETTHARYAHAASRVIGDTLRDLFGTNHAYKEFQGSLLRSVRDGTYPAYLRASPINLPLHVSVCSAALQRTGIPDGARRYLQTLVEGYEAMETAMRASDPDGMSLQELASVIPELKDADTNFSPYREFWARRGVSLEFVPRSQG